MQLTRRGFLKWAGGALLGGAAAVGYVTQIEPEWLTVERQTIQLPQLAASMDGFKIVQRSDFQLFPYTTLDLVEKAIEKTNELAPDLV
ncbi:MAG: twin-arginine translocation signal domain-containing protein, partial [Chloroflexi bacterium]|nr:twin-arginine translocation signal domain-containing protein [Chloroflexota bacterium]